jgi:ethanolamine utilization microcompartment shell protein EutS
MKPNSWTFLAKLGFAVLLCNPSPALAQTLGTATTFAVLGGSTVTNTGSSVVTGDLGVSPGTAITGFPPGIVVGTIHSADAVALQAQSDVTTAYNALAGLACTGNLTGTDLGGLTLTAGVYCFSSSAQLTGILTLNAQGDPAAVFVFQIGSTLTTASNSSVVLINGAQSCNVFWQVGSSATLGTDTAFAGNILALTSITLNTGASISGRALARNGAVTMDTNNVSNALCSLGPSPTPTLTATAGPSPTPTFTASPGPSPTSTLTATAGPSPTPTVTATFGPSPTATQTGVPGGPPPAVPTLSGWAMIAFGGLLAMVALAMTRRAV